VAKKARTPKPPRPSSGGPRPVQAPKRRTGPSRTAKPASSSTSLRWFWPIAAVVVAIAIVGAGLGIVLTRGSSGPKELALKKPIGWKDLPGLQTGPPPWGANGRLLSARIGALNLTALGQEALTFHIHQHLDIFVNGKHVTVPPYIGYGGDAKTLKFNFITELHTHQGEPGYLHVESGQNLQYVLGQFMGEWGVKLTRRCLGDFDVGCKNLRVYVNGKRYRGNPELLPLKKHDEIVITVGTPPKTIPSKADFSRTG
jgi:hypothetical protein